MLLIEGVAERRPKEAGRRTVSITHAIEGTTHKRHVIRVYLPKPMAGPYAGELLVECKLDEADARELKAHL